MKVNPRELVGNKEVADMLSWSPRRVAAYSNELKADMPLPVTQLAATRVWLRSDIIAWARRRGYPLVMDAIGEMDGTGGTDTPPRPRRRPATRRAQDGRKRGGAVPDTTPPA